MNIFPTIASLTDHNFAFLEIAEADHVLQITLNRPAKKNALHPKMVEEIAYAFQYAHEQDDIWLIQIGANGNVFCAGADLKAMAGLTEAHDSSIPKAKQPILIGELFNKVHKPTIVGVNGDVYAGGFFFLAGATIVIAADHIKLGLPEVKRGLYPFQVMAALLRVMPARKVLDWCMRGYNLPVQEAQTFGLVTEVVKSDALEERIAEIIAELKQNSPTAMRNGLKAYDHIQPAQEAHQYLLQMLMETMRSKDGQEGLKAFREKRKPEWSGK